MKRRLLALIGTLMVLTGMFIATAPVSATGNCSTGYIQFFKDGNFSGSSVKMCWSQFDGNWLDSLGPDENGVYHTGWHDQLSSFRLRAPAGYGVCLYRNELYSSLWHQSAQNENWNIDIFNNDQTDSFKWAPLSPINHLAAC